MEGGKDFLMIFGLIIAMVFVSISLNQLNTDSSFGKSPSIIKDGNLYNSTSGVPGDGQSVKSIEIEIEKIQKELKDIEEELAKIEKFGETSPYKGMVTIVKSASGARSTDIDSEYIKLTSSNKNDSGVKISEWKLESVITGQKVQIGNAARIIFSGEVNVELPIILRKGESVYVTTGRSPVGVSFSVNKCTGYFTQFQQFTPSLYSSCPDPEEDILYHDDKTIFIDNACMDFVERLPSCRVYTKPLPLYLSNSCQRAIVEEINYNSCIEKHKDDSDFKRPEWRVFLKRNNELWREKREIIKLVDENDKLVDVFSY